jgi:hypothetical protein
LVILLIPAFAIGFVTRQWAVLLLGPVAGAVVVGVAAGQHLNLWDTPAVFVAVAASAALAAGVLLGRSGRNRSGDASVS